MAESSIESSSMGTPSLCVPNGILGCTVLALASIWKRRTEPCACDLAGALDDVDEADDQKNAEGSVDHLRAP